jgi:rare lipoprotein A
VEINDRGPFVEGRIIDLSRAAARALGLVASGTAPVRVELIADRTGDRLAEGH